MNKIFKFTIKLLLVISCTALSLPSYKYGADSELLLIAIILLIIAFRSR